MRHIKIHETPMALWHESVKDAQVSLSIQLTEEVEAYLVFMLMRYIENTNISESNLAEEYLEGSAKNGDTKVTQLRRVGDKCLLFSGLFPGVAERRNVDIKYFIDLGRTAYQRVGYYKNHVIFHALSDEFICMMDVLQSLNYLTTKNTSMLQAYELWENTGSRAAYQRLIEEESIHPSSRKPFKS